MIDYIIVALLGASVAAGELFTRHRDRPATALSTPAGMIYVAVNVVASVAALVLIRQFGWKFGVEEDAVRATQVLVAGFGAMAFLRSSLFLVRVGNEEIGVGPGILLAGVADAADEMVARAVARKNMGARASLAHLALTGISFDRARTALPAYCLALGATASPDDQAELARQIALLQQEASMDERQKVVALGLVLMNALGEDVVLIALRQFSEEMRDEEQATGRQ